MKIIIRNTVFVTLLFLSATLSAQAQQPIRSQPRSFNFQCSQGKQFRATFFNDRALVRFENGRLIFMRQVPSGSGIRYQSGQYTLSSKGNQANITQNDQPVYQDCTTLSPAASAAVTGTVIYRERIALPPNAIVKVQLQDTSRADAPAVTLAEQTIQTQGRQVPIPFTLEYDPSKIREGNTYTVRAQILVDGQLRFASDTSYPVLTNGNPSQVEILVRSVRPSR